MYLRYAAFLHLKCCSNRCRINPAALVPHLRSASTLAFNVTGSWTSILTISYATPPVRYAAIVR